MILRSATVLFKQPKPFYMIFFIEMWERFGFYGMQAIMVLYLVKQMGFSDAESFNTYSAFTALIYSVIAIGGYIGDNILGTKRTILLGAIFLALGYAILGFPNPNSMYFGMGWQVGFSICAAGLLVGIANYFYFYKTVKNIDSEPGKQPLRFKTLLVIIVGGLVVAGVASYVLRHLIIAHIVLILMAVSILYLFFAEIGRSEPELRGKLIAALILIIQGMIFFILYQQMPTSLNFYAINNVQHSIMGFAVNPLSFQALNPFWIFIMSPILAWGYTKLGAKNKDLSMPSKFTLGITLCSLSFLVLALSRYFGNAQGIVSSWWIIFSYFLQSTGELLVSGLGLAMVAHLVPQRLMGFIMGAWFMGSASGIILGGMIAGLTNVPSNIAPGVYSLNLYASVFEKIGFGSLIIAVIMAIFIPKLKKMMQ
ncbi:MAG: oligopeptide:H+ symporter [Gammaproteobacteria bacterium]|nr:oligopeptide:H+ symporter [Gammaproteobacteria bacterium]